MFPSPSSSLYHPAAFASFTSQAQQLLMSAAVAQQQFDQHIVGAGRSQCSASSAPKGAPINASGANERCAVCSDRAQGIHFGVVVCRACAAFFRRSTIAKRVYRCRFDGNCPIGQKEVRCSCRACRLAKCLALGMDPNAVQRHRDQIGPRKQEWNGEEGEEAGEEEGQEPMMEMKPRLLTRTSTEETEPHLLQKEEETMVVDDHPPPHHPNGGGRGVNNNNSHLLPPLTLMGSVFQLRANEKAHKEEQADVKSKSPHHNQQQQIQLHFEDGKSYALLGSSPLATFRPSLTTTTSSLSSLSSTINTDAHLPHHQPSTSSASSNPLSDLLLRVMPSAFSPIQTTPQPDSGNVSANSSAFSSPLNLAGAIAGHQNSPIGISTATGGPPSNSALFAAISPSAAPTIILNPKLECSSAFDDHHDSPQPLLAEMLRGYRKYLGLRRTAKHLLTANECPLLGGHSDAETIVEGTYTDHVQSIKIDLSLLSQMLDEHFHPLGAANFGTHSKSSMLRNFFFTFIIAERCHLSTKHFPGEQEQRLFCSPNTYLDIANLDRFFAVEQCRTDPADVAKVFQPVFFHFQKTIRQPMAKLGISELEFIALIGLLFWNHRIDALTEQERRMATQMRERIFDELYQLCRANGRDQNGAGARYCTLLNMHHFCQKAAVEIASAFSLVNVVQKFETDEFLNQFHPLMF